MKSKRGSDYYKKFNDGYWIGRERIKNLEIVARGILSDPRYSSKSSPEERGYVKGVADNLEDHKLAEKLYKKIGIGWRLSKLFVRKLFAGIGGIFMMIGLFFLSLNMTGNIIFNIEQSRLDSLGGVLFILGIISFLIFFRIKIDQ